MHESEVEEDQRETHEVSQLLFHERELSKRKRDDPSDEESEEHEWNGEDQETISAAQIIDLEEEEEEIIPKKLKKDVETSSNSFGSDIISRPGSNLRRIILDSDED